MNGYLDGVYKAIGMLFIGGVIYITWKITFDFAQKTPNIWKMLLKGIIAIIIIAFIANSYLGTHQENCDPDPYGSNCDIVRDYQPSQQAYNKNFAYFLTLLGIPFLMGAYSGYNKRVGQA